jgi:hypothetical protein
MAAKNGLPRDEHLQWCRERAMAAYRRTGRAMDAVESMVIDLGHHEETRGQADGAMFAGFAAMATGALATEAQVQKFVDDVC